MTAVRTVRVLFFASLRESVGKDSLELEMAQPITLDALMGRLKTELAVPAFLALTAESVRVALNQELVSGPVTISGGDELAFLPPVTGG
jgi:molybdopterin converting factor subunit 1